MREKLIKALEEARDLLAMVEGHPLRDTQYQTEVDALGERIGYGALMTAAQHGWRESLYRHGYPVGGEFVAGPAYVSVLLVLAKVRDALAVATAKPERPWPACGCDTPLECPTCTPAGSEAALRYALERIASQCADMTNQQIYDVAQAALAPNP